MVFLHVSDAAMVRDVCLCVSLELGKSTYNKDTHRPLFGDGILKSNGASWSRQRKLIAPHFFPDKVKVHAYYNFTHTSIPTFLYSTPDQS